MRVALFCEYYHPFISGVVTHIDTLRQGLEAAGHEVLIVTLDPKAKRHYIKDGVLYCPAIPLKKIYGYGVGNPLNLKRLRVLKAFNPDVIHLHTEFTMGFFALFAARRLKKPVVYTLHTMYDDYLFYLFPHGMDKLAKPAAHTFFRNVAKRATEIIGPSLKVAEFLRSCGVTRHINIIPNTVDLTGFMPGNVPKDAIAKVRADLNIKDGDVCLCFVGRLGKEKSLDVLVNYFAHSFAGKQQFKLFIIGDGPERDNIHAQVAALRMESQVRLLGKIDHKLLPAYYNAFDLFTTASLSEMNSISMLEATASGLYALQRLDIYNRDQIKSGVNGDVFTTPQEFGQQVSAFAQLDANGRAARKKAVSDYAARYGVPEFTAAVMNVYERAMYHYAAIGK